MTCLTGFRKVIRRRTDQKIKQIDVSGFDTSAVTDMYTDLVAAAGKKEAEAKMCRKVCEGGMFMFCKYCGTELKQEVKFCPNCGRPVGKRQEELQVETIQNFVDGHDRYLQKKKKKQTGFTWNKLLVLAAALIILIAPQMAGASAYESGMSYHMSIQTIFQEDSDSLLPLLLLYVPSVIGIAIMLLLQFFNHPKISLIGAVILTLWAIVIVSCLVYVMDRYKLDRYMNLGAGCYMLIAGVGIAWISALIPPRTVVSAAPTDSRGNEDNPT